MEPQIPITNPETNLPPPNNNKDSSNEITTNNFENLTTFQKIIKLQEDLKIISSIKQQFEENRRKMIEKIILGCQNYFKNKISMKKIFDYCTNNEPEKVYEYILLTDKQAKESLGNNYNNLFNFFFILRNDNNLMLKLIENFEKENYEDIGDFLVNFCYEDTINNSFIQEEMLILIYLLLEKYIFKIDINNNNNNLSYEDYYETYIKSNILYPIFIALTRKADVRNYLCNILSDIILYMENLGNILTVDIGNIHDIIRQNEEEKNLNKSYMKNRIKTLKNREMKHYLKNLTNSIKKIEIRDSGLFERKTTIEKIMQEIGENNEINIIDIDKVQVTNLEKNKIEEINLSINKNINLNEVDPFFINTDTTQEYLEKKLKEYEEFKTEDLDEVNRNIILAMKEYLSYQINDIKNQENSLEKFSNFVLINSLNSKNNEIKEEGSDTNILIDYIKSSYENITEIISNLLNIIKKNLKSIPFIIKSILKIIEFLLNYKYNNEISLFQKYMFKANFFLGNIIIPILQNPFYNGIITENIISQNTLENCKIISAIFNLILSGKLFYVGDEPCKTIFNQFIIEILPEIFEIVQSIELNFNLPEIVNDLINSIKDMNNPKRKINYNYFYENDEEKFQIQSICFSFKNAINIIKSLEKISNEIIMDIINIEKEKKDVIESIIKNADYYKTFFNNKLSKSKTEFEGYIFISKINYLPLLEDKMNSILKDNFISLIPPVKEKFKEEEISRFKRCLSEVLTYSNLIHKVDITTFTEINSNKYVYDNNLIELLMKKLEKKRYEKIMNNESEIIINNSEEEKKIILNPDFKNEILPEILIKVKGELGSNSSDENYQRILYCCSYIQLHIELLPEKYSLNNYKNLCIELIKDTEDNVHILRNNILNQLNIKIKGSSKTNLIIASISNKIKNMEKLKCIQYLYNKIELPSQFHIEYNLKKIVKSITYVEDSENLPLKNLCEIFPDFSKTTNMDDIEDLISFEEKVGLGTSLDNFFKNLKKIVQKENILKRYSIEEIQNITSNLVDFIYSKLYPKIFPKKKSKKDDKFYKKCLRLQFIKPENLMKNKNVINENLCQECYKYINDIDKKITPVEKIKYFGKAFSILQNSMKFSSGEKDLGVDDTLKPLIYVMIKAKPENIFSNYDYCRTYLDKDLSKHSYGALLTQIGMIINIIKDMKYNELIDVTEEQFGFDEE